MEINFSEVDFVDSSGIGLLLNFVNCFNEKGIKIKITHVSSNVKEHFRHFTDFRNRW
ncbi:STAS domain-containing protein [Bacillus sp. T33-2]|uniref:STAS domain-containing protein n=1 Tax=Bacillus sp. T33-2 TaxID=2054168 RepID=UPI000C755D26|nr:hypothetical protein CVD19_23165 [Bacillus sp. T33-2]